MMCTVFILYIIILIIILLFLGFEHYSNNVHMAYGFASNGGCGGFHTYPAPNFPVPFGFGPAVGTQNIIFGKAKFYIYKQPSGGIVPLIQTIITSMTKLEVLDISENQIQSITSLPSTLKCLRLGPQKSNSLISIPNNLNLPVYTRLFLCISSLF